MAPTTRSMAARMLVQELTGPVTRNIVAEGKTPARGRPSRRSPKKPFIGPKRLSGRPYPPELKRRTSSRITKRVAGKAIARGTTESIAPPKRQATILLEITTKANHGKQKGPAKSSLKKKSSQKRKKRWSVRKSHNNAASGTNKKEKRPKADVPQKRRERRPRSPTLCELFPVIYPNTRRHRKLIQLRAEVEAVAAKSKPAIQIVERAESEADGPSCISPNAMEIRSLQSSEFTGGAGGTSSQIYYFNINDLPLSGYYCGQ